MSINSKYGLRNANDFLNRIRRKYAREIEESHLIHNKTFIEEESLELYENVEKEDGDIFSQQSYKGKQEENLQKMSQIKQGKPSNTFCERLIVKNLQQTLRTYEQDLGILTENKELLQQKMELMSEKIRKLKELQVSNKVLLQQNEHSKEYLAELVKEYHYSMHMAFRSQIQQQELFNSLRSKVRMVLKDTTEDYNYIGFIQYWNNHIELLTKHRKDINLKLQQEAKAEKSQAKDQPQRIVKIVPVQKERKSEQEDFLGPDEPKPKKKMSESERASLLGDLKSFAKNFKFPSG